MFVTPSSASGRSFRLLGLGAALILVVGLASACAGTSGAPTAVATTGAAVVATSAAVAPTAAAAATSLAPTVAAIVPTVAAAATAAAPTVAAAATTYPAAVTAAAPTVSVALTSVAGAAATASSTTVGQLAASGQTVYTTNCASCHGAQGQGGLGPPLIGSSANLAKYDTALGLLTKVSTTMPRTAPASLPPDQYLQVTSYLLVQNNYVQSGATLSSIQFGAVSLKK